jgi:subtilase family serine protease
VQAWAWYSLVPAEGSYNGWLFDPSTRQRTVYGDNFAAYTTGIQPEVNLTPIKLWAEPVPNASHTVKLVVQVSNNGNIAMRGPTSVRFYSGDPAQGGLPIGSTQVLPILNGCGATTEVAVTWDNAPSGTSVVWAVVDFQNTVAESNESDNRLSVNVTISP